MNALSVPGSPRRGNELSAGQVFAITLPEDGDHSPQVEVPGVAKPGNKSARFFMSVPLAGYLGLFAIVVLSLMPIGLRPATGLPKALDHGIAYAIVSAFLVTVCCAGWRQTIVLLIAIAGVLKIGQVWVPGRDSNPIDFLGSSVGALVGAGFSGLVLARGYRLSGMNIMGRARVSAKTFLMNVNTSIIAALAAGIVAVVASVVAARGAVGWLGAGLALLMLTIAVVDGRRFFIPDYLNAAGLVLGVVHAVVVGEGDAGAVLAETALRAAVLALLFLALRLMYARLRGRQGIGLGDVKLAAVAGAWLGWSVIPIVIEIAALSALCVYALRCYVLRRPLRSTMRLPFGLFFAPAIWVGWLLQATVLHGW